MNTQRTCLACGEVKPLDAFERGSGGGHRSTCKLCRRYQKAERRQSQSAEREERQALLQDDIWSAMRRGQSRRALQEVSEGPTVTHRIKLRNGQGYISIAEMACRCQEREACYRAAASCRTFEAASAAARILEQPTPPVERSQQLRRMWWTDQPRRVLKGLKLPFGEPDEDADPFEEAFGDWAPRGMRADWLASCPP